MKAHHKAIYGTDASPFAQLSSDLRCTQKVSKKGNTKLYFHILKWPKNGQLSLPVLENEIVKASLIGSKEKVSFDASKSSLTFTLPKKASNSHASVLVLKIKGKVKINELMSLTQQASDRSVTFTADKAKVSGPNLKIQLPSFGKTFANLGYWTNKQASANFTCNIHTAGTAQAGGVVTKKSGRYDVYINYSSASACGGDLLLTTVDNQTVTKTIKETGDWNQYKRLKIGTITLKKSGRTSFKIQASSITGGAFINLKSLEILPID